MSHEPAKTVGKAIIEERRKLLLTMLGAVYVDAKETKSIVAIKPKPPLKPVFQVEISREKSDIHILNEPLKDSAVFRVETGETLSRPETMLECYLV